MDKGKIIVKGEKLSDAEEGFFLAPEKRNMGLVFQSYALWPNMTVEDNIKYPLDARDWEGDKDERVREMLEVIGMEGYQERYPSELSGGESQRVALARSLSYDPRLLLLDEPLSNLDLQERLRMRRELTSIIEKFGLTALYVTHDQEEAFELSERVVVVRDGRKEQEGSPVELYEAPKSPFIASFIGESNILQGSVQKESEDFFVVEIEDSDLTLKGKNTKKGGELSGSTIIRPDRIQPFTESSSDENKIRGKLTYSNYRGGIYRSIVDCDGVEFRVDSKDPLGKKGEEVTISVSPKDVRML